MMDAKEYQLENEVDVSHLGVMQYRYLDLEKLSLEADSGKVRGLFFIDLIFF